jgi:hypothetical protein
MKRILPLLFLLASAQAYAQTWFTVANENDTVVFNSLPVTFQFGVPAGTPITNPGSVPCTTLPNGCWDNPVRLLNTGIPSVTITANLAYFDNVDPAEGTVKVLQVQETAVAQAVTVNGVVKIVPALPAPPVTPPVTPPIAYILTIVCNYPTPTSTVPTACTTAISLPAASQ